MGPEPISHGYLGTTIPPIQESLQFTLYNVSCVFNDAVIQLEKVVQILSLTLGNVINNSICFGDAPDQFTLINWVVVN